MKQKQALYYHQQCKQLEDRNATVDIDVKPEYCASWSVFDGVCVWVE